jgi:hypothetical protein
MSQGWSSLQQLLGPALDPKAGRSLARARSARTEIGNSTIAQLYLAGKASMQNAINNSIPMSAVGSSQTGYDINRANIAASQALAGKMSDFATSATATSTRTLPTRRSSSRRSQTRWRQGRRR